MLTQNELNISNKSYTNKDFNTIYSELLDLVLTLTNKWDPTHSNESDPGVVLIKLAALMADKNNYSIDKNILECFPLSASQEGNVRAFYDLLGYSMGWYNSATCYVNITSNEDNSVSLEPFKYIISDSDGKINYTLIGQTEIGDTISLTRGISQQGLVMEGAIQDFTVGGSNIVKLENLDSNLRLYFSEKNVAENGIFISNLNDGKFNYADVQNWVKVDNLASTESTQKCYKFGVLPNSNTCYIQFSPNINRDIADGLIIKYLVSNGENGRIAANVINTFSGDVLDTNQNKITLKVYNPSASTGGYNPQDLEDAYTDYKRVINTFSTLVTEKDYENFIYELRDTLTNRPIVSNVVVSDRTDDIGKTNYVVRLQSDLNSSKKLEIEEIDKKPIINAYNIAIYALKPPTNLNTAKDYDTTFTPVDKGQENDIEALMENVKSIQHDYIDTHPSDSNNPIPYIYKNKYTLQGTVYTYNKVTDSEARDIEDNIQKALFNNFNAREVEFGYDVSYDHLVDVITKADSRIRLVALNQPEYYLTQMNSNGATESGDEQSLSAVVKKGLLTKMISKGNVELFNYDKRFNWDFGQLSSETYDKISSITTKTVITAEEGTQVTVRDNENVQFFRDNYIVKTSYSTYVTYSYEGNDKSPSSLSEGIIYNLTENDKLKVSYTNEDGQKIGPLTLTGFIRPVNVIIEKSPVAKYLSGNQAIEVLELNTYTIRSGTKCFWVTTDFEIKDGEIKYKLFEKDKSERILDNNEYFIYLDESQNVLNILQSGTKLTRDKDDATSELVYPTSLNINISNVMEQGTEADGVEWYELTYDVNSYEESIISLGSGSTFTLREAGTSTINNSLTKLENGFSYVDENGNDVTVNNGLNNNKWKVRSRLNINASESTPQHLLEGQSINIPDEIKSTSFYTNSTLNISGGENINVQELQADGTYKSTLSIYSFTKDEGYILERGSNGWLSIDGSEKFNVLSDKGISFSTDSTGNGYHYIIPVVFVNNSGSEFKIEFTSSTEMEKFSYTHEDTSGKKTSRDYNYSLFYNNEPLESYNSEGSVKKFNSGIFYPYVKGNGENITLKITAKTFAGNIYIGNIYKLPMEDNFSTQVTNTLKDLGDGSTILTDLNEKGYDWTYSPLPEDLIDTDNVDEAQKGNLFNPKVVWDANHICNKFTIAQYNANNSSIKISSTSKQR